MSSAAIAITLTPWTSAVSAGDSGATARLASPATTARIVSLMCLEPRTGLLPMNNGPQRDEREYSPTIDTSIDLGRFPCRRVLRNISRSPSERICG